MTQPPDQEKRGPDPSGGVPPWVGTLGIMLCGLGLFTVLAQMKFSYSPVAGLAMLGVGAAAIGAPRIRQALRGRGK